MKKRPTALAGQQQTHETIGMNRLDDASLFLRKMTRTVMMRNLVSTPAGFAVIMAIVLSATILVLGGCGARPAETAVPSTTVASDMTTSAPISSVSADSSATQTEQVASSETAASSSATDSSSAPAVSSQEPAAPEVSSPSGAELSTVNEAGKIPVVMFHRFIEAFEEKTEKSYTCTFQQFETLLEKLYADGFRLIPMSQFLSGRIAVPIGFKPVVFTFDDGTASQFSLIDANGALEINPRTAAGMLIDFQKKHPDFGLAGTFFLNMDVDTFSGAGTLAERLTRLTDLGFDVGTHTWGHTDFTAKGTRAIVEESLGKNQKALADVMPSGMFRTLALPYGSRPKDKTIRPFLAEGEWEGTAYRNDGVFAVGAGPSPSVFDDRYDALYIPRIRATGKVAVEADLDWWLGNAGKGTWYVSDGNPDTVTVQAGGAKHLVREKLGEVSLTELAAEN